MRKYLALALSVLALGSALSLREWLLLEEIEITKIQVKEQIAQHLGNSFTVDRVRELSSSPVVFERYLSPVFETANRLLWPSFRMNSLYEWKRRVHTQIEEDSLKRLRQLSEESEKEIAQIREKTPPSLNRLFNIVELTEGQNAEMSCVDTVRSEMKSFKDASTKKDEETLSQLKAEGVSQIKHLTKLLKGMNAKQISQFFTTGQFHREIEEPVLHYVFKLKNEETRKASWELFQRKVVDVLSQKKVVADRVVDKNLKAQKEIEKLIESMAKVEEPPAQTEVQADIPKVEEIPAPLPLEPLAPAVGIEEDAPTPLNPADSDVEIIE